jgi:hypothetical protein
LGATSPGRCFGITGATFPPTTFAPPRDDAGKTVELFVATRL